MGVLDYLVLGLFALLVAAIGAGAAKGRATVLKFLAAGRSLTLPWFVASLVSTWYGGVLGAGESVFSFGLGTWVLMGLPYYVFALIYAYWYAGRVREADQISIPERLEAAFGRGPALIGAVLVFLLGVPAAHVLMLGYLADFFGWAPLQLAVPLAALAGGLFIVGGGLVADVRFSMAAFCLMYLGFAVMTVWCLASQPPQAAWAVIENKAAFTWDGGQGPLAVASFFLLGAWTLIDPGFHQRTASAESPATARKGILVSIVCWMVFDGMTIVTGMYALALSHSHKMEGLAAYPTLAMEKLPDGLRGVFLAGVGGTILSALVGYSLVSGAGFGRDLVARLKPGLNEVLWTRIGIGASLIVACAAALSIKSVVAIWYSWGGCIIGALILPVSRSYGLLRGLTDRPGPHVAGMAAGFGVSIMWMLYGLATGNLYLTVSLPAAVFGYTLPNALAGASFGLGTLLPSLAASAAATQAAVWLSPRKGEA